jgi:hypothetical protein
MVAFEAIERLTEERPALCDAIARVAPAAFTFEFQSPERFKDCAKSLLLRWLPKLAGRSLHVRFHRRGSNTDLRTLEVERLFNDFSERSLFSAEPPTYLKCALRGISDGGATNTIALSIRFAEHEHEGHDEDLFAEIVADMHNPAAPVFRSGHHDE